jgi:hypothetical protein
MSISPKLQILNYWVTGIESMLRSESPHPPAPPKGLVGDKVEDIQPGAAVMHMCNALQTVLCSEPDERQVSNQTHLKIYSLANEILVSFPDARRVESRVLPFLETYYKEKISKIDQFFRLKGLITASPDRFAANDLRLLEKILFQYDERED